MSWRVRIVGFQDFSCIGVFNGDPEVTSVMLSSSGEFAYITSMTGDSCCHLTRFMPSRYINHVGQVLRFRNRHAPSPFLCERFNPAELSVGKAEVTTLWPSVYPDKSDDEVPSSSGSVGRVWMSQHSVERKSSLDVCPYARRVRFTSTAVYNPDTLVESGHRCAPSALYSATGVTQTSIYPLSRAPPALTAIMERKDSSVRVHLPACFASSAPNSAQALAFFTEMIAETSLLYRDLSAYPTATDSLIVTTEFIDGDTYILAGPAKGDPNPLSLELDAWFTEPTSEINGDNCFAQGSAVLSLRGDFFKVFEPDYPEGRSIHVGLLLFDETLRPEEEANSYKMILNEADNETVDEGPSSLLWRFRRQARRLVCFRDYLEANHPLVPAPPQAASLRSLAVDEEGRPAAPPGPQTREPILLRTSNGTKFTAFLDSEGRGTLAALRGAFPDRTQVHLCLMTQMASCVLPDGETATYSLAQCIEVSECDDNGDVLTAGYIMLHRSKTHSRGPSPVTASHVRALLAFRRWVLTPQELRHELVEQDRQISLLAQAAALQNQRHGLVLNMQRQQLGLPSASEQTQAFRDRLRIVGRDAALALALAPSLPSAPLAANPSGTKSSTRLIPTSPSPSPSMSMSQSLQLSAYGSAEPSVRLDKRLAAAVHNTTVRQRAKNEIAAIAKFLEGVKI